jgi:chorismate synthase
MRFLTAGESHGKGLTVMIDDFPAGVPVRESFINEQLARRQIGYGRGGRMHIEKDQAEILSGIRFERSTGAPIALFIENRDFKNWTEVMAAQGPRTEAAQAKQFVRPRPGHADLAGYYKYDHPDLRDVLERSSARETAARVAAGAVAQELLSALGIEIFSHVTTLGGLTIPEAERPESWEALRERAEANDLRAVGSDDTLAAMRQKVDEARMAGTTLGGEIEVVVLNAPPGLGSYVQWDRKLDGLLAQAVMSIQAVKSVSIGAGETGSLVPGSAFHDAIVAQPAAGEASSVTRPTNRAGGLEGGVTNGMPVIVKAVMKPIATMRTALASVNLETGQPEAAHFERSDVTAVAACGVVCEAMVAVVLARAILDKFGRDTLGDIQAALAHYQARLKPAPVS